MVRSHFLPEANHFTHQTTAWLEEEQPSSTRLRSDISGLQNITRTAFNQLKSLYDDSQC